jgi:hypothetical protein
MMPIAALYVHQHSYLLLPGHTRFVLLFISTAVPAYAAAMLFFNIVEKNGILLGKRIVKRM